MPFIFDKEKLETILKSFASSGKIFTNESQFQFELSRAIDDEIIKYKRDNNVSQDSIYPCVKLEVLSMGRDEIKEKREKLYTDIVICLGENEKNEKECVAIELKYKMINKNLEYSVNDHKVKTFSQGAYDIGSIQFLEDVERLEKLTLNPPKIQLNFDENNKIIKSFAVIISNDKSYWIEKKDNKSIYNEFCLDQGEKKNGKLRLNTYIGTNGKKLGKITKDIKEKNERVRLETIDDYERYGVDIKRKAFVDLCGEYKCNWKPYDVQYTSCKELSKEFLNTGKACDYKFQYLIFEIGDK